MNHRKPKDFGSNPYYLKNSWIREKRINESGHNICLENPEGLIKEIFSDLADVLK